MRDIVNELIELFLRLIISHSLSIDIDIDNITFALHCVAYVSVIYVLIIRLQFKVLGTAKVDDVIVLWIVLLPILLVLLPIGFEIWSPLVVFVVWSRSFLLQKRSRILEYIPSLKIAGDAGLFAKDLCTANYDLYALSKIPWRQRERPLRDFLKEIKLSSRFHDSRDAITASLFDPSIRFNLLNSVICQPIGTFVRGGRFTDFPADAIVTFATGAMSTMLLVGYGSLQIFVVYFENYFKTSRPSQEDIQMARHNVNHHIEQQFGGNVVGFVVKRVILGLLLCLPGAIVLGIRLGSH